MKLITVHQRIFVVGDPQQTIFSWRHANCDINLKMLKDTFSNLLEIDLNENYRSTKNILHMAAALTAKSKNDIKPLISQYADGEKIRYKEVVDEKEEAMVMAQDVAHLVATNSAKYGDIAILFRTNFMYATCMEYLTKFGIPFKVCNTSIKSVD